MLFYSKYSTNILTLSSTQTTTMRFIVIFIFSLFFAFAGYSQQKPEPKKYVCYHTDIPIIIDGNINDSMWLRTEWTDDFMDIQGPEHLKPTYTTKVKMLWSDSFLYVAAFLEEPHIWAYLTEDEMIMYYDNDFEVFIDPDSDNHNYYEFEFNALNKKWDLFLARSYREKVKPDLKWNCKGLQHATKVYGTLNNPKGKLDSAWTIEIAIPIKCIQQHVDDQHIWRMNFSRVEWDTKISGKKYKKLKNPEHNWVWSPQWEVNMHQPEYWGYVQFSKHSPGTTQITPRKDHLWDIKMRLMQAHKYQKSYFKEHGSYSDNIPSSIKITSIEVQNKQYIIRIDQDWGSININETGRIWRTKMRATPRFWVWMHPNPKRSNNDLDSIFRDLKNMGIYGVLMGANSHEIKRAIPIAKRYNIQIHAWIWAMNRRDAPEEYMSVNARGESLADKKAYVDYYKFMCPAIPEVSDFIHQKLDNLERIDGLSGIHLDYIRYVDVFLPKGLLPKYNIKQDSILPQYDYGYHPAMINKFEKKYGKPLLSIQDYAHDSLWQQFRMDQITDIVNNLNKEFWSKELKLSAAVFPDPLMSRTMVRQDWGNWNLDYYFPMVYNGFYNKSTFWIYERMITSRSLLPNSKIFCGLYIPNSDDEGILMESMDAAFKGGASGIALFNYSAMKKYHKNAIRKTAEKHGSWITP